MRVRSIASLLAGAAAVLLLSVAAHAVGDRGAGLLDDVDSEKRTVTVVGRVFHVVPTTEMVDGDGKAMKLHELEAHLGELVVFRGLDGNRGLELEWLELTPDDD